MPSIKLILFFYSFSLATIRFIPYQYDNRAFESDPQNALLRPVNEMNLYEPIPTVHPPRRPSQMSEIEAGRTKLHRLLDEVLDKAEPNQSYNPDSENQRRKRRRQHRRIHSISYDPTNPLIINDNQQIHHTPIIPQVSERPDPSLLRLHYNPYEAGDRAHEIERSIPVELKLKYLSDDNDIGQRYTQTSYRSKPPLFYDDSVLPDPVIATTGAYGIQTRQTPTRLQIDREVIMRPNGVYIRPRQHKFDDNVVFIDPISKNRDGTRVQLHNDWPERENNNDDFFLLNISDLNNDPTKRHDYHDEYMVAKQSVVNTKNLISSIHDDLQQIVSNSPSDNYHA